MISFSLMGRLLRYFPGTIGPEIKTSRSPASGWPARTRSIVTYSHSCPASRIAPATYRGYGEMYGGTPKFDGSSTYPSRITTFMGRNPCRRSDKRASPSNEARNPYDSFPAARLATTIKITITTVITTALTTKYAHPPQSPLVAVVPNGIPAVAKPDWTTVFHIKAITKPKAAANEAATVLRTSAIEIFRSPAMFNPGPRWRDKL